MKKLLTLLVFAILLTGLVNVVFGDYNSDTVSAYNRPELQKTANTDDSTEKSGTSADNPDTTADKSDENRTALTDRLKVREDAVQRVLTTAGALHARNRTEILERFKAIDSEHRERLENLSEQHREKLDSLNDEQLKRLAEAKADELRKIASLNKEQLKKIAELDKERLHKAELLGKERLKDYASLSQDELEEKLDSLKVVMSEKDELVRKRVVAKTELEAARRAYTAAKERYDRLRDEYKEGKDHIDEIHERVSACRNDTSASCRELRDEAFQNSKELLTKAADRAIAHLEKLKSRVEESNDLSADRASEIVSNIDDEIFSIFASKAKIEAASTSEELRDAGKELKRALNDINQVVQIHKREWTHASTGEIVTRAELLERRLERVLASADESNIETRDLDALSASFSEHVLAARTAHKNAETHLEVARNADTNEERVAAIKKARDFDHTAQDELKQATEVLQEITHKVKEAGLEINEDALSDTDESLGISDDPLEDDEIAVVEPSNDTVGENNE